MCLFLAKLQKLVRIRKKFAGCNEGAMSVEGHPARMIITWRGRGESEITVFLVNLSFLLGNSANGVLTSLQP